MKILIKYTQAGKYRDRVWDALTSKSVGTVEAVCPSYAAHLIAQNKASLVTSEDHNVIVYA